MMSWNDNRDKVFGLVSRIPLGRVSTYGLIGKKLNINPRLVGRMLHQNSNKSLVPCHRVVRRDGRVASGYAFGGSEAQIAALRQEGIVVVVNRIDDFLNLVYNF